MSVGPSLRISPLTGTWADPKVHFGGNMFESRKSSAKQQLKFSFTVKVIPFVFEEANWSLKITK